MKRFAPLVLVALIAFCAANAGATNLLTNGSFQSGDFTGWTYGTTADGTFGTGYPAVTGWPLGGSNAAKMEVGEVSFNGQFEGGWFKQNFNTTGGSTTLSFNWAAMGDGIHNNADGGLFELILDGSVLASIDLGSIGPNDLFNGTLTKTLNVSAGAHTFEIDVLRPYTSLDGNTPYQFITAADVEGQGGGVPEPGTLVLLGSGVLGMGSMLRRKLNF
jgi:hypothetical protein